MALTAPSQAVQLAAFLFSGTPTPFFSYCYGRDEFQWWRRRAAINQALGRYGGTNSFLNQARHFDNAFTPVQHDTDLISYAHGSRRRGRFIVHSSATAATGGGAGCSGFCQPHRPNPTVDTR